MTVDKQTAVVKEAVAGLSKHRHLVEGSEGMRSAGEAYLPKFSKEDPQDYQARLKMSFLFNGYGKTIEDMAGKVFVKPVVLPDASDDMLAVTENVDMAGRHITNFAMDVFKDGMAAGVSYILVDAPSREGVVTKAQAKAENLRPFMTMLKAEEVLGWKVETDSNATVLSQFRFMENIPFEDEKDEFADASVQQIRVLTKTEAGVSVRLYRQSEKSSRWEQWGDETYTGLDEITVVPFYAKRRAFMQGIPPLNDLADLNIAHWQSQSDQRNILHVARVPILFGAGFGTEEPIIVSSKVATTASDPAASLSFVEHSGAAIAAGQTDLDKLEFHMQTFGLQLLVERTGNAGATGAALDAEKETSQLGMMVDSLVDALETAFKFAGLYLGTGEEPEVEANKDFSIRTLSAHELNVLMTSVTTGEISQETFLNEMKLRGLLSEGVDVDAEIEATESEGMNEEVELDEE